MSYTDLTGDNFRRAHSELMAQKHRQTTGTPRICALTKEGNTPKCIMTRTLEVVAVIVGIVLGALLLAGAANCGMARGAAWEVGDYATHPCWND